MKKNLFRRSMVDNIIWDNTYQALTGLVENCYFAQATYPPAISDNMSYWKEFCTVRMYTARRSGHTTSICKVAHEYFRKALILAYNLDSAQKIKETFENINVDKAHILKTTNRVESLDSKYYFESINSFENCRGLDFEAVFVDCAFMLSKQKEDKIYNILAPSMAKHSEKFFIFVE